MTLREINPSSIAAPAANYAHAVLHPGPPAQLHTSGVVPIAPDGSTPDGLVDQARVVWANLAAILDEAGLGPADVVSVVTYVVADETDLSGVMAERDRALDGRRAASTLVTVPRLVRPEWKMEIAIVAVASDGGGR